MRVHLFPSHLSRRTRTLHVAICSEITPALSRYFHKSSMASNRAAFLTATKAPLEIREVPYPAPKEKEIVVRNRAIAINPVDWFQQEMGPEKIPFLKYPAILGYDIAGEVEALGSGVTKFKVGDRVTGLQKQGFQEHVLLLEHMATVIPGSVTFEQAAALPMGVSVATKALFHKDYLALDLPSASPSPKDETVLIWGGSTSVGSNVIQLAVAAGYEVIATASPGRFEYVEALGASQVFDCTSRPFHCDGCEPLQHVSFGDPHPLQPTVTDTSQTVVPP